MMRLGRGAGFLSSVIAVACGAPQRDTPARNVVAAAPSPSPAPPPVATHDEPATETAPAPVQGPIAASDAGVETAPREPAPPPSAPCDPKVGWATRDERTFTLRLPCDVLPKAVQGIDSQVGEFESKTLTLSYDYGMYSDPLTSSVGSGAKVGHEVIGGLPATVVTGSSAGGAKLPLMAAVHFPGVGGRPGIKLTVYAECASAVDQATAKKIFRSIRFSKH